MEEAKKFRGVILLRFDYQAKWAGVKFDCPVCGYPTEKLNRLLERRFVICPNCDSKLEGLGRAWWVKKTSIDPRNWADYQLKE